MRLRSVIFFCLLLLVLTLPVWVPLGVAAILIYFLPRYFEAIALGVLADLIYATSSSSWLGIYTLCMLALYIGIQFLKPYVRNYAF